jgi:hypothetical protein
MVMVESQPQRTAGAVPAPSVVAGVDATLLAARQLLNNPPYSALRHLARQEGGLGVSLDTGLLLL